MGERVRGRAGQALRLRRMVKHPICAECYKIGQVRQTDYIDHINPLAAGGEDVDENTQGLCALCHAIKTAGESLGTEGASNHPEWLKPALKPLVIVCGPPCSGKSTYVRQQSAFGDLVIDLDAIAARLSPGFKPWKTKMHPELFNRAIRTRNAILGSLSTKPGRPAWFIVGAPHPLERNWWAAHLGGRVVLLNASRDELRKRAVARDTPLALAAIDRWCDDARGTWSPQKRKLARVAFGDDGYPLES